MLLSQTTSVADGNQGWYDVIICETDRFFLPEVHLSELFPASMKQSTGLRDAATHTHTHTHTHRVSCVLRKWYLLETAETGRYRCI